MESSLNWAAEMEELSPIEIQIIRSLIAKEYGLDSPFLDQLTLVESTVRRMTGKGYYLDLLLRQTAVPAGKTNAEVSGGYPTLLGEPRSIVGFTLFIRDGVLSWLEGYTFGGASWPAEPMDNWLILRETGANAG